MKLLTWNVWYQESPENILELLREQEWDVCCLQEITQHFHKEPYSNVPHYLSQELGIEHFLWLHKLWVTKLRAT